MKAVRNSISATENVLIKNRVIAVQVTDVMAAHMVTVRIEGHGQIVHSMRSKVDRVLSTIGLNTIDRSTIVSSMGSVNISSMADTLKGSSSKNLNTRIVRQHRQRQSD